MRTHLVSLFSLAVAACTSPSASVDDTTTTGSDEGALSWPNGSRGFVISTNPFSFTPGGARFSLVEDLAPGAGEVVDATQDDGATSAANVYHFDAAPWLTVQIAPNDDTPSYAAPNFMLLYHVSGDSNWRMFGLPVHATDYVAYVKVGDQLGKFFSTLTLSRTVSGDLHVLASLDGGLWDYDEVLKAGSNNDPFLRGAPIEFAAYPFMDLSIFANVTREIPPGPQPYPFKLDLSF